MAQIVSTHFFFLLELRQCVINAVCIKYEPAKIVHFFLKRSSLGRFSTVSIKAATCNIMRGRFRSQEISCMSTLYLDFLKG